MSLFSRLTSLCKLNTLKMRVYTFNVFTKNVQTRKKSIFTIFRKPTVERFKIEDNMPDEYNLIYRNTMHRYLLGAQIFSTVFAGIVAFILIMQNDYSNYELKMTLFKETPKPVENEMYVYFAAFIGVCVVLQITVARTPIRIYNYPKQKKYIFISYGTLPYSKNRLSCYVEEVTKVEEKGILPWNDSIYKIKDDNRVYLIENYFRRPADLSIMLGHRKNDEDD